MTLLITLLFLAALLVLVAGGLLVASNPCLIPPDAPRTFPGPGSPSPAPGKLQRELAEDDHWWREWWINADSD